MLEFRLPDLGEGLTEAELVSWTVAVGDRVELNQTIAEVETAKAQVALPSPYAGQVAELLAAPGDTVPVGAPLIRLSVSGPAEQAEQRTAVLVGYGPEGEFTSRRRRPEAVMHAESGHPQDPDITSDGFSFADFPGRRAATPGARKLAGELGVAIDHVPGSGPGGAVTVDDVRHLVPVAEPLRRTSPEEQALVGPRPTPPPVPAMRPDAGALRAAPADRETRTPVSGVRKRTAAAMNVSATIPQATVYATTDVTASLELMDHLRGTETFAGLTLSPLALVARAALAALEEFPGINSSWDEERHEIVTKHFVNLGIAVATERGLLVPSVKEAQALSLRELCREIGWLADVCRAGSATPADLRGGTFTISNIGVFGVDTGVALVNPGEGAILSLGTIRKRPWVYRDELAVRWVTTLGVSFDHRMIDGELASRFLSSIAASLEDPLTLLGR
ncbi:2-oxo acid dehydrogenase subunit E2 [Nocardia stercoris]|uniref:Dihydrolipoamide acetyltransferase component of pyruvate dehydrogenase complex n=1 Tax=Nocardia stercoris TaxID=2483361 RepID=A0A3M2LBC5_9NOCA|nr:2-oxo acid dehydrogenase subunit E2 [Nocardia stercoris]